MLERGELIVLVVVSDENRNRRWVLLRDGIRSCDDTSRSWKLVSRTSICTTWCRYSCVSHTESALQSKGVCITDVE